MARTPDGFTSRSVMVSFRLRPSTAAELDRQRGQMSRTEYLERLIKSQGRGPDPFKTPKAD